MSLHRRDLLTSLRTVNSLNRNNSNNSSNSNNNNNNPNLLSNNKLRLLVCRSGGSITTNQDRSSTLPQHPTEYLLSRCEHRPRRHR